MMFESFTASAERALKRADRLARRRSAVDCRAARFAGRAGRRVGEPRRGAAGGVRRRDGPASGRSSARKSSEGLAELEEAELPAETPEARASRNRCPSRPPCDWS